MVRKVAAVELQLHVPVERRYPRRHCFENFPGQGSSRQHEKTDAAGAELRQPVEFRVGDTFIDDDNAPRIWADVRHRLERASVIFAVGRRLHDHRALYAEPAAHLLICGNGRIRRHEFRGRGRWIASVIDVHVGVAETRRRLQFWFYIAVDWHSHPCGQISPVPLGLWKHPTEAGKTCFGSQSTTSGKYMQNAIVAKKTT